MLTITVEQTRRMLGDNARFHAGAILDDMSTCEGRATGENLT